jgi:hypothetical protein
MKERMKKDNINYDELYKILLREPLDYKKIKAATGVSGGKARQIIDTLSLRYPLYQISRGVYGLLKE